MEISWTAVARRMLRRLLRRPGFTLSAFITLALGIGATTAIFTVVAGVLLRPLPYRDDGRLVRVFTNFPGSGLNDLSLSPGEYVDVRARSRALDRVAAFREADFSVSTGGRPRRLSPPPTWLSPWASSPSRDAGSYPRRTGRGKSRPC